MTNAKQTVYYAWEVEAERHDAPKEDIGKWLSDRALSSTELINPHVNHIGLVNGICSVEMYGFKKDGKR